MNTLLMQMGERIYKRKKQLHFNLFAQKYRPVIFQGGITRQKRGITAAITFRAERLPRSDIFRRIFRSRYIFLRRHGQGSRPR